VTPVQTWVTSKSQAENLGGYLASIRSGNELEWIWRKYNIGGSAYWNGYHGPVFGGYKESNGGDWNWVSGEAWDYSNFWSPNDSAGGTELIYRNSYWGDTPFVSVANSISMIVEWNTNPIPAPAASALLALAGLVSRRRRA